jgi:hypothetical protein
MELKDIALLLAAVWAFYKLTQTGGLHPLLDLKVSGRYIEAHGHGYLLCSVEVKNVHLPMVLIKYSAVRISWAAVTSNADVEPKWQRLGTFPVFEGEEKVWSGETIRDKLMLVTPSDQHLFKLEFRIGRKYGWSRRTIRWVISKWFYPTRNAWMAVTIVKRQPDERAGEE